MSTPTRIVALAIGCLAACRLPVPATSTTETTPDQIPSEVNGSTSATTYNATARLLARADDPKPAEPLRAVPAGHAGSARLLDRLWLLDQADATVTQHLVKVTRWKLERSWHDTDRFEVEPHEIVAAPELVARLEAMRARAQHERAELAPQLEAAYRSEFPGLSAAQLAMLDEQTLPTSISDGAHRGESCWTFDTRTVVSTTCWSRAGAVASHTEQRKPEPVVERESEPVAAPAPELQPAVNTKRMSAGDCRALVDHDSGMCDTSDCRALVNHDSGMCDTSDCRALVNHDSGMCDTNDCRALVNHDSGMCDTSDCRALVNQESGMCDTSNCRALVGREAGMCGN